MNALVYHIISYASSSSSSHFLLSGQIYTHTHARASALHFTMQMQMRNKSVSSPASQREDSAEKRFLFTTVG